MPLKIRWPDSLAVRIPLMLIGVQAGCVILALLAFPLLAPFTTYDTIADTTTRRLVLASLGRGTDGDIRIEPSPALLSYMKSRPDLSFAAIDHRGSSLPGSMPDMSAFLQQLRPALPRPGGNLETDRPGSTGGTVFVTTDATPMGDITFATAGNVFRTDDIPSFVDVFMPAVLPAYGPLLVGALFILPFLLRRLLRPLRAVAAAASRIDVRALDRRLPAQNLPAELRPAVTEINTALDRLAGGWARQSLFTANAAHELRTPVAILQARIDAMAPASPDRPALARDARRLRLLVDQLLTIARLDHRETAMEAPVDLVTSVRASVADCAPLALRSGRAVAFHTDAPSVIIVGDTRAIEGAVANLIDNALRAEPEGGTVDVVVHSDGGGGTIEVRDHGAGIAPDDRTLVFEPFWRKDERSAGTGLGLTAVREVARLHGGSIAVDETPGGGATFRIFLPAVRLAQ